MASEIEPGIFPTERDNKQVEVFMLRGLEDIPKIFSRGVAKSLGATSFDSNWYNKDKKIKDENLTAKLRRLGQAIDEARNRGKQVILIGVSAGAALAEAYMLQNPDNADNVLHLYSLSGVLDPKGQDFTRLRKTSSGFNEIVEYLEANLTPDAVKRLRLPDKISAYSSKRGEDKTVPYDTAQPAWIKKEYQRFVAPGHVGAIAQTIIFDIHQQLNQLSEAKFD